MLWVILLIGIVAFVVITMLSLNGAGKYLGVFEEDERMNREEDARDA